jgi:hypothetical protein
MTAKQIRRRLPVRATSIMGPRDVEPGVHHVEPVVRRRAEPDLLRWVHVITRCES